jgi:uncharacterized protein involved in response to NO
MVVWMAMLSGWTGLPIAFAPVDWHAQEMLFGYLPAAVAGFLLTAAPNWTGRLPILGWPLAALVALWLGGRVAVACAALWPSIIAATIDVGFLAALAFVIAREVVAGKNWRNLKVLGLVATLGVANALFHFEAAHGDDAASGVGARLGVAAAIMLIIVVGGRITPSFTRNWLARQKMRGAEPASFDRFDTVAMSVSLAALALWAALPATAAAAVACGLAGVFNAARLARWAGWRAWGEPLVWVLHAGFAFASLGFLLIGASHFWGDILAARAAQHAFTAGAIGVMTLAVMTRASLGHTGRHLHAGPAITAIYVCAILAALVRVASGVAHSPAWLLHAAGGLWVAAFVGFVIVFAPILMGKSPTLLALQRS